MSLRLNTIRIFVSDLESAISFYSQTLDMKIIHQDHNLGWAQIEIAKEVFLGLEVVQPTDSEFKELVGRFTGISLKVEDIHITYTSLYSKGVQFTGKPVKQSWGGVLAHFKDPDENLLTLVQVP